MRRFKKIFTSFVALELCSIVVLPSAYCGVIVFLRQLTNSDFSTDHRQMILLSLWLSLIVTTVMLEYIFSPNAKKILDDITLVIIKKVSYITDTLLNGDLNARYLLLSTLWSAIMITLLVYLTVETVIITIFIGITIGLQELSNLLPKFEFETTVIPLDLLIKSAILLLLTV